MERYRGRIERRKEGGRKEASRAIRGGKKACRCKRVIFFKVVGAHPASSGMMELEVLRALESRVASLERELREHQEAICASPPLALRELKRQVDSFKNKLETTEHLSWLGEYVDEDITARPPSQSTASLGSAISRLPFRALRVDRVETDIRQSRRVGASIVLLHSISFSFVVVGQTIAFGGTIIIL